MIIHTTRDIDVPASAAWQVLGEEFADVYKWAEAIIKSSLDSPLGEGAVRTCDLKAFGPFPPGAVTEEITHFNRDLHALTYAVRSGMPGMIRSVENAWTVEPLGDNRCRVQSHATFDFAWWAILLTPIMRIQMKKGLAGFADEFVEKMSSQ